MNTGGPKLTEHHRRIIKGMRLRKDRVQDVAYLFAVSPATVHGIEHNKKIVYLGEPLPPKGPYQLVPAEGLAVIERKAAKVDEAEAKLAAANELINELEQLLERHRSRRDQLATRSIQRTCSGSATLVN